MRPKIVIAILVAAFSVLAIIAVLKGVLGSHVEGVSSQPTAGLADGEPVTDVTNQPVLQVGLNSSNTMAVSEEIRAAVIQNELDEIHGLPGEVDGTNNSIIIEALLAKMASPEAEVRKAVLQALVVVNDTNAVPGLEKAAQNITDPREKVAVLDAIDFIKTPSITENLAPEFATNTSYVENSKAPTRSGGTNSIRTSPLQKNERAKHINQRVAPPNAPTDQPVPAEAPAQPQ